MLKRVCDRCKKEIDDDNFWFQIKINKMNKMIDEGRIYCGAGGAEFCENCFNDFKAQLANNN